MQAYLSSTLSRALTFLRPTILRAGESYTRDDLRADIIAGITVAGVQTPQTMALALIAGLPAVYGLYASLFGFVASLWGSSRQLSTGPVAIVSFLTLSSLIPLAEPGSAEFIGLAATLALLVGILYLIMGLFRLGFIINLVPHSVIFGFSSAAAVIIIITQIPTLLGVTAPHTQLAFVNVFNIVKGLPALSLLTCGIGAIAITLLIFARRLPGTFPGALIILALGVLAGFIFPFSEHGVSLVGQLPQSLPSFAFPWADFGTLFLLLPKAAIIALVGFVGAHASAKIAAQRTREHLDTNQELVGQGLANFITGLFHGFPVSGSFTRTAVNVEAGGRTAIASVVTALITVAVLLYIAPLFNYLPRAILAAIVIVSAIPLIDIRRLRTIYHISRTDGVVAFLTFGMAFVLKPDDTIFIGILVALVLFIRQTVWGEHVVEMGIDRNLNILSGNIEKDNVDTFPDIAIVRIGVAIYYANAAHILEQVDAIIARQVVRESEPVKTLVLDVSGVNFIDVTGIEVLSEYFENLKERGINIGMMYVRSGVRESLERTPRFPQFKIFQNIAEMRHTMLLAHR